MFVCLTCNPPPPSATLVQSADTQSSDSLLSPVPHSSLSSQPSSSCPTTTGNLPFEPKVLCYGCSIACHGSHHIVELYQKRNFRCDCQEKYQNCTLFKNQKNIAEKQPENNKHCSESRKVTENDYSKGFQNFMGLFCVCHSTYNDDEEDQQEKMENSYHEKEGQGNPCLAENIKESVSNVMFQCAICEDWFHETCIGKVSLFCIFETFLLSFRC